MTLEKQIEKFCRGLWQVHSSATDISQDEEFKAIVTFVRDMVLAEREACAKIAEECASAFEEAATKKARTTLNRVLNEIGSADCKHVAQRIRERSSI